MPTTDTNSADEAEFNEKKRKRHFWRHIFGAASATLFVLLLFSLFTHHYTLAATTGVFFLFALSNTLQRLEFSDKSGHLFAAMTVVLMVACLGCFIGVGVILWTHAAGDRALLASFLALAGTTLFRFAVENFMQAMSAARGIDLNNLVMAARRTTVDGQSVLVEVKEEEMVRAFMGGSNPLR